MLINSRNLHSSLLVADGLVHLCRVNARLMSSNRQSREEALRVLRLSGDATKQEIKSAYLELSKELHPDLSRDEEKSARWLEVKQAYDSLREDVGPKGPGGDPQGPNRADDSHLRNTYQRSGEYNRWKRRQNRNKEIDEWLKNLQRESREHRQKFDQNRKEEHDFFNQHKVEEEENVWHNGRTVYRDLDENYKSFEKSFNNFLDKPKIFYKNITGGGRNDEQKRKNSSVLVKLILSLHQSKKVEERTDPVTSLYPSHMSRVSLSILLGFTLFFWVGSSEPTIYDDRPTVDTRRKSGTLEDLKD